MAKLSKDLDAGTLHPRENLVATGNLSAANAELQVDCDGASTVALDLRGTFNLTVELAGTVDGTNWILIPVRSILGGQFLIVTAATTQTAYVANCAGFNRIRARCVTFTSGSATATLSVNNAVLNEFFGSGVSPLAVTAVGAAGAAVTLTLPAPGLGLRQYITALRIRRFAAATLTAAATPVTITTTNLPGAIAFSVGAEALAQGVALQEVVEDFAFPLMATAQNAAVTVVCPATPNVIWRATAWYQVAP
jgi:hypothetical protein